MSTNVETPSGLFRTARHIERSLRTIADELTSSTNGIVYSVDAREQAIETVLDTPPRAYPGLILTTTAKRDGHARTATLTIDAIEAGEVVAIQWRTSWNTEGLFEPFDDEANLREIESVLRQQCRALASHV